MNPVLKRTLTGLTVGITVILAVLFSPPAAIYSAFLVLAVLASFEFAALLSKKWPEPSARRVMATLLGAAAVCGGLLAIVSIPMRYGDAACGPFRMGNVMLLYVLAIVKFSDVGGFAFGLSSARLMKGGNHKMCPSISPNKSWEGLFGSVFMSCVVSCSFMGATGFGWTKSLVCGVVAALVGTFGDLVESKFKRWVGVKDSSAMRITNGMGGLLDMFDSLLFAPAALLPLL